MSAKSIMLLCFLALVYNAVAETQTDFQRSMYLTCFDVISRDNPDCAIQRTVGGKHGPRPIEFNVDKCVDLIKGCLGRMYILGQASDLTHLFVA